MAKLKVTKQQTIKIYTSQSRRMPHIHSILTMQFFLLIILLLVTGQIFAEEEKNQYLQFTGVIQIKGTVIYPQEEDAGYDETDNSKKFTTDDELLRLIANGNITTNFNWEAQYLNQRLSTNYPLGLISRSTSQFRFKSSRHYFEEDYEGEHRTIWFHELDRLFVKYEYEDYSVIAGRQAISWGSGRFWQPTDVFGAFSPIELEREFKPGIDAVKFDFFPTNESDLALTYVFGNRDEEDYKDSIALHFRTSFGQDSEITLLVSEIAGIQTGGGSFETGWLGIGWRAESVLIENKNSNTNDNFSIAGLDYQFSDNLLFGFEYYYNTQGATQENNLSLSAQQDSFISGQQKHLSQNVLGIVVSKTLTPLLNGNYNLLASSLESADEKNNWSYLHQLSLTYSITDEMDALLAAHYGTGKGLNTSGIPQSEFGHIPTTLSLRLQAYF